MKRFYSLLAALCMLMSLPVAASAADNVKSEKIPVRLLSDVDAKESKTTKAEQEKETNYKVKALEDALKNGDLPVYETRPYEKAALPEGVEAVPLSPLKDGAFAVGKLHKGTCLEEVLKIYGYPQKRTETTHLLKLTYEKEDLAMRVILRKPVAPALKENNIDKNRIQTGVESVYLTKGDSVIIGDDLTIGTPVEILIRRFGRPDRLLRDTDANVYYFVYSSRSEWEDLVFAVGDRKIRRVAMMPARPPYTVRQKGVNVGTGLTKEDFTLMGFQPGSNFSRDKYNMWQTVIKRGKTEFWLYGDYGVESDGIGKVQQVFLLSNSAYTSRGITLGYHVSTLLAAYGVPNRIIAGPDGEDSVDAYYYDSPYDRETSLVFTVQHEKHYINDIILTNKPIKDIQDSLGRYGLKERKAIAKEYT